MQAQIFTDTIEDNNGIVDGITDDGQKRRNKGRIYLALGEGKDRQDNQDIMHQGKHCRNAKAELEAVRNIRNDEQPRNH